MRRTAFGVILGLGLAFSAGSGFTIRSAIRAEQAQAVCQQARRSLENLNRKLARTGAAVDTLRAVAGWHQQRGGTLWDTYEEYALAVSKAAETEVSE